MHTRDYISYSQLIMWENSPAEFIQKYFHPDTYVQHTNRGQSLGKEVADALEKDEPTGKLEMDAVIAQIPKMGRRDEKIFVKLSVGKYPKREFIPILIKPDMCEVDYTRFIEVKTGSGPWNQKLVDENDQISFYTAGLYIKTKPIIPTSELIWAPTEKRIDEDGVERPHLIGNIKRFPTSRTFADILRMHARMSKAWREIGEAMEKEII